MTIVHNINSGATIVNVEDGRGDFHTFMIPGRTQIMLPDGIKVNAHECFGETTLLLNNTEQYLIRGPDQMAFAQQGALAGAGFLFVLLAIWAMQLLKRPVVES